MMCSETPTCSMALTRNSILGKLSVRDRTQAARTALQRGLVLL